MQKTFQLPGTSVATNLLVGKMVSLHKPILIVVLAVLSQIATHRAEIANSGPLVYHSWPPIGANSRAPGMSSSSSSAAHQHHQHHHPQQQQQQQRHHHHLHQSQMSAASAATQLMYQQLRSSPPASSMQPLQSHHPSYRYQSSASSASALQSAPSNIVYTQQKLRAQPMAAAMSPTIRYIRPAASGSAQLLKMPSGQQQYQHQPQHYSMPSAKPVTASHQLYPFVSPMPYGVSPPSGQPSAALKRHPSSPSSVGSTASKTAYVKTAAAGGAQYQYQKPSASSSSKQYASSQATHKKPAQPIVDYVFEKPLFGQHQLQQKDTAAVGVPISTPAAPVVATASTIVGTALAGVAARPPPTATKYNPIQTIQAPNLAGAGGGLLEQTKPLLVAGGGGGGLLHLPLLDSNHLFEKDTLFPMHLAFSADRPTSLQQYQVTEPTIDQQHQQHLLRTSAVSALFAPDVNAPPAGSSDHHYHHQQHHQYPTSTLSDPQATAPGSQPAASALVAHQLHYALPHPTSAAQSAASAAAASYATHLRANQQMMQLQQQQPNAQALLSAGNTPMAAYNPTYLVQQSNQLFDTHKQHLFRPERQYLHQRQPVQQHQQQFQQQQHRSPLISDLIETEFLPSFQLPSGDYAPLGTAPQTTNSVQHVVHQLPQQQQHQHQQQLQEAASNALTVQEVANLLNFGSLHQPSAVSHSNAGFVASNFYQETVPVAATATNGMQPTASALMQAGYATADDESSIYRHQQQNEERINEATRHELLRQQQANSVVTHRPTTVDATIFVTRSPEQRASEAEAESAHQRHQQRLAEQLQTDMRIYVPDEDYAAGEQSDTFHKRSDDFGVEQNETNSEEATTETTDTTAAASTELKPVYEEVNETETTITTPAPIQTTITTTTTTEDSITTIDNRNNTIVVEGSDVEASTV